MNKKLMAVAVAGALAVPGVALAQSSTVQIGGSLTAFYYKHQANNPSVASSGDILETSEPELYVKGEEKLGGGLSFWFQCTSSMDAMIGGSAAAQGWCGRNSGVGFTGSFGNVFAGNWDTPQKLTWNKARGWFGSTNSVTGGGGRTLYGNGPSGVSNPVQSSSVVFSTTTAATVTTTSSNTPAGFARRQSNAWNYWSPSWSGFSITAAISADNESTGRPDSSTLSPRLYSIAGNYLSGPLTLAVSFEQHKDYNPANATQGALVGQYSGGNDDNWTFVAGYKFAGFDVRGLYSQTQYDVVSGQDLKVKGYGLFADWAIAGPHTLRAQYVHTNDTSGTSTVNVSPYIGTNRGLVCGQLSTSSCASNTGSDLYSLVYSYAFSKRTEGSVVYTRLNNDDNAAFSLGKVSAVAGQSQYSAGLAIKHRF